MIHQLKQFAFRAFLAHYRRKLARRHVVLHPTTIINKMPDLRLAKGSRLILHEDVTLTSNGRHNPLLLHPVMLRTLTPQAVIEFMPHSGITGSTIVCANRVTIGEYTVIGANTLIYDSFGHTYSEENGWSSPRALTGNPISIGKKCFIGVNCIVMGGVTIGDNCLVSAGTVVTADIPAGHKAFGNPMQIEPLPKALGGGGAEPSTAGTPGNGGGKPSPEAFLAAMKDALEFDFEMGMDDEFREYEDWDSIAFLSLSSCMKEDYGVDFNTEVYNKVATWREVYNLLP